MKETIDLLGKIPLIVKVVVSKKYIFLLTTTLTISVPSSYYIKEGGGRYFGSYCKSIFRLGPTALFIATLAVIMVGVYRDRKAIFFLLVASIHYL